MKITKTQLKQIIIGENKMKQLTKSQLREVIREEIQKQRLDKPSIRKESINEATKYDIAAALRDVREYNRKNIPFDHMAKSIVKNLGFKPTSFNINQTKDHLRASSRSVNGIVMDKDVIRELYGLLK